MARLQTKSKTYDEFVKKFEPKKTTDDCYTPTPVYEVVADFVCTEYGIARENMIRPFYPGGDYQSEIYTGRVVVDNPPFSILSQIVRWYNNKKIPYFLFAPSLTLFATASGETSYIVTCANITYANGAKVKTSFVTNLEHYKVRTAPRLKRALKEIELSNRKKVKSILHNNNIISGALMARVADKELRFLDSECEFIRNYMSEATGEKITIYGGGFELSGDAENVWKQVNQLR